MIRFVTLNLSITNIPKTSVQTFLFILFIYVSRTYDNSVASPDFRWDNNAMNGTQHNANLATLFPVCSANYLQVYFFFFLFLFLAAFLAAFFASASAISAKIFCVSSSASTSVLKYSGSFNPVTRAVPDGNRRTVHLK